jgi:hypothetical protein
MNMHTSENQKATGLVELTEAETDRVAGGAPGTNQGNAYGGGTGAPGNNKGQGPEHENYHGRFWSLV